MMGDEKQQRHYTDIADNIYDNGKHDNTRSTCYLTGGNRNRVVGIRQGFPYYFTHSRDVVHSVPSDCSNHIGHTYLLANH